MKYSYSVSYSFNYSINYFNSASRAAPGQAGSAMYLKINCISHLKTGNRRSDRRTLYYYKIFSFVFVDNGSTDNIRIHSHRTFAKN